LAQDCFPFLKQRIGEFEVEQFELVCCQFHIVWVSLHEKKKGKKEKYELRFSLPKFVASPHPKRSIFRNCTTVPVA
jgi:hypothetical protein